MVEPHTSKRKTGGSRDRLMLCNLGRLGDTILRNSILDSAFRTYGTVDYICGPHNAELIRSDSRLNMVTVFDKSLSGWARLVKTALRHRYEAYIELKDHYSFTSFVIARLFRSRVKTGCNSDNLRAFHRDARAVCLPNQTQTETMRAIGELAALEAGEYKPSLVLSADSINWFRRSHDWERPYIFLNISATGPNRVWPTERWVRYVQACGLEEQFILISGVPGDRQMVDELCAKLRGAVAFHPRQFMDVAAAINDARLVLTVDTGVVHACSALNKPIVALYCGPEARGKNRPLSDRQLVIAARGSVANMDAEEAIAQTLRQASFGWNAFRDFSQGANRRQEAGKVGF
jgi:heptosyltransferase II